MGNRVHQEDKDVLKGTAYVRSNTVKDGSGSDLAPLVDADGHLQVDVLTGGGGGTQYDEDDAHSSGDTGTMALVVRQDAAAALSGTDGDYTPLISDANGRLHTLDANSAAIKTAVEIMDDWDDGSDHCKVIIDAPIPTGSNAIGKLTANDGVDIGDVTVNNAGGVEVVQDTAADFNCTEANSGAIKTAVELIDNAINGSEMQVDVVASLPAGTNAIGKLAANTGVDIGDVDVTSCANTAGDVAHDGADSGNPLKVGGKAYNFDGTAPGTAVAENDRANMITDVYGRQFVETAHPRFFNDVTNFAAAQTNTSLVAAPGAGLSLYITDIVFSCDTAGNFKLVEDTGGTPVDKWEVMYFAANGGCAVHLKTPIKLTANKDLGITSVNAGNHSINVCGYTAP
jgi:hypothetical protein